MKTIAKVLASCVIVVAPVFAFAQSQNAPLTRAQVKAELAELQRAGYSTASGDDANYPNDIQAAEAKVAAQHNADQTNQAYGGMHSGAEASGSMQHNSWKAVRPMDNACVGPVEFCVPYFGS
jgi:hypothetical protein